MNGSPGAAGGPPLGVWWRRGFTPRAPVHKHALPVFALLLGVTGQMRGGNALPPSTAQLCKGDKMCSRGAWSLCPAQPGRQQREWLRLLKAACCSLFFPSRVLSSHLDPASTHSSLQGSSATVPEHPSGIDPLMEQDEGPGTPPAKQSAPSSRSANARCEPSSCAPQGVGGPGGSSSWPEHIRPLEAWALDRVSAVLRTAQQASRIWVGSTPFLFPLLLPALSCFPRFSCTY